MRYAIVSDIHANWQAWTAVQKDMQQVGVDAVLCLGDVVGYGPEPSRVLESVYGQVENFVLGNHDAVICDKIDPACFNDDPRKIIEWTRKQLNDDAARFFSEVPLMLQGDGFLLTHAEAAIPDRFDYIYEAHEAQESFDACDDPLIFVGHTHFPCAISQDAQGRLAYQEPQGFTLDPERRYLINVGSVGDPRNGDTRSHYLIFDQEKGSVDFRRVAFDVEGYRRGLAASGLPTKPLLFEFLDEAAAREDTAAKISRSRVMNDTRKIVITGRGSSAQERKRVKIVVRPREQEVHFGRSATRRKQRSPLPWVVLGLLLLTSMGGAAAYFLGLLERDSTAQPIHEAFQPEVWRFDGVGEEALAEQGAALRLRQTERGEGRMGFALAMQRQSSAVGTAAAGLALTGRQPFYLDFWISSESDGLIYSQGGGNEGARLRLKQGRLEFVLGEAEGEIRMWSRRRLPLASSPEQPKWQHVAVSCSGSGTAAGISLYLNGRLLQMEVTADELGAGATDGGFWQFGRNGDELSFIGLLDDVRMLPQPLTEEDLLALVEQERRQHQEQRLAAARGSTQHVSPAPPPTEEEQALLAEVRQRAGKRLPQEIEEVAEALDWLDQSVAGRQLRGEVRTSVEQYRRALERSGVETLMQRLHAQATALAEAGQVEAAVALVLRRQPMLDKQSLQPRQQLAKQLRQISASAQALEQQQEALVEQLTFELAQHVWMLHDPRSREKLEQALQQAEHDWDLQEVEAFQALRDELLQLAGMPREVIQSFSPEAGSTVAVQAANGSEVRLKVLQVGETQVKAERVVEGGTVEVTLHYAQLSPVERARRLGLTEPETAQERVALAAVMGPGTQAQAHLEQASTPMAEGMLAAMNRLRDQQKLRRARAAFTKRVLRPLQLRDGSPEQIRTALLAREEDPGWAATRRRLDQFEQTFAEMEGYDELQPLVEAVRAGVRSRLMPELPGLVAHWPMSARGFKRVPGGKIQLKGKGVGALLEGLQQGEPEAAAGPTGPVIKLAGGTCARAEEALPLQDAFTVHFLGQCSGENQSLLTLHTAGELVDVRVAMGKWSLLRARPGLTPQVLLGPMAASVNEPHFHVLIWEGGALHWFVDGRPVHAARLGLQNPNIMLGARLDLGQLSRSDYLDGWLADVQVYNRKLSAEELAERHRLATELLGQ